MDAPSPSAAASSLKVPAIILIVLGVLSLLNSLVGIAAQLFGLEMYNQAEMAAQLGEDVGKLVGQLGLVMSIAGLVLNGLMTFGALQMLRVRGYGLAVTAAVLAFLPTTCCCVITLPFGIWALVVLMKPEVKAAFRAA
jgi:hypothetical protein